MQAIAPLPDIVCATGMPGASAKREQRVRGLRDVDAAADTAAAAARPWRSASRRAQIVCAGRRGCAAPALLASLVDRRNPPRRSRARRGRHPPARRAPPGPAGPRSRPRRRGAPARGCGFVLDADQLLHGGLQNSVCRASCVMFFRRAARLASPMIATSGDAGVERLHQRGDQVGGAGAERRVADAGPVGDPRIGVGGERAAALVVDQVVSSPSARTAS